MQTDALSKDLAACGSPETLLAAILKHHPDLQVPVQVEMVALRVGIVEFRVSEIEGVTSALSTDIGKTTGIILCAAGLSAQRRRFAIAHQLGHFLLAAQRGDRQCSARDLGENRRDTPHRKEEMQANRFAAGLLMPKPSFVSFLAGLGKPNVAHLPTIATTYDVTLEAAASRYADLTQATCALIFVKAGVVRFARPSRSFPPLSIRPGDPTAIPSVKAKEKPVWMPAEIRDWIVTSREARPPKLMMQVLGKDAGVQLVMLFVNGAAERRADEEAEKFATERPKFGDGRRG